MASVNKVLWHPILEVPKTELQPILSPVRDWDLCQKAMSAVGLIGAGFNTDPLFGECLAFKAGRSVLTHAINPDSLGSKIMPSEEEIQRWFEAADYVLRLTRGTGQFCYGTERVIARARIFGPRISSPPRNG